MIERPVSVPREGEIDAFDAGWKAHEIGISRQTVDVLSSSEYARGWALLAWDIRQALSLK